MSLQQRRHDSKDSPSVGKVIVWLLAGFLLSIIGVIITIILAAKNRDNIGIAALVSGVGMVFWLLIFFTLFMPAPAVSVPATVTSTYCGDGICNSGESWYSCSADCTKPVSNSPNIPKPSAQTNTEPKKPLQVTINSAEKFYTVADYTDLETDEIYLVIDFSIKNIGQDTYDYNPYDIQIEDEDHYTYEHSTSSYSMSNYFGMVIISPGETKRGTLAFKVPVSSKTYNLILTENWFMGDSMSFTVGNVETPPQDISGEISIDKVSYDWTEYDSEYFDDSGYISEIELSITNTGNVPFEPRFDIQITHSGRTIYEEEDMEDPWAWDDLKPGETSETSIYLGEDIDDDGRYDVEVVLKAGVGGTVLDTASKTVNVS